MSHSLHHHRIRTVQERKGAGEEAAAFFAAVPVPLPLPRVMMKPGTTWWLDTVSLSAISKNPRAFHQQGRHCYEVQL